MDEKINDTNHKPASRESQPNTPESKATPAEIRKQKLTIAGIILVVIILVGLLIAGLVFLLNPGTPAQVTARIRDVFIIMMALEFLVIGLVLIVLVVQIARLTNLLQNEIKPILDSTNETISTLRGTTRFISDNVTEPIIKLNEYLAGIQHIVGLINPVRRNKK